MPYNDVEEGGQYSEEKYDMDDELITYNIKTKKLEDSKSSPTPTVKMKKSYLKKKNSRDFFSLLSYCGSRCLKVFGIDSFQVVEKDQSIKRGLFKYSSDSRGWCDDAFVVIFGLITLYSILVGVLNAQLQMFGPELPEFFKPLDIIGLLSINFLILSMLERKYDNVVCIVLFLLRVVLMICLMPYFLHSRGSELKNDEYVVVEMMVILGLWIPIAVRQSFRLNCLEILVHILGRIVYCLAVGLSPKLVTCWKSSFDIIWGVLFLTTIFWAIEYLTIGES